MKLVIEANIPYIRGIFEPFGTVEYLAPDAITPEAVKDADGLIVRTRTKCNKTLLEGSRCRFVGTATIGTDHIDLEYCKNAGITTVSAPGCNAPAVAQYVLATAGRWAAEKRLNPADLTLGIVGVGHVGSIISRWAKSNGIKILECDPPRQRRENGDFVSLQTIAEKADIITFHTPLNKSGEDATYHLGNSEFFKSLKRCRLVINSARGSIFDNEALVDAMQANEKFPDVSIDCWEGEPNINKYLLQHTYTATPHIAGYSSEGKHRATDMMVAAAAKFFNLPLELKPVDMGLSNIPTLERIIESYNPHTDTKNLRNAPGDFEALRNHYDLRPEP